MSEIKDQRAAAAIDGYVIAVNFHFPRPSSPATMAARLSASADEKCEVTT